MASNESTLQDQVREQMLRELGARRMPAKALAAPLNVSDQTAQKMVRGEKPMTLNDVETVGKFFGRPIVAIAVDRGDAA